MFKLKSQNLVEVENIISDNENIRGVIFDCFGTLMQINQKTHPYKYLLEQIINIDKNSSFSPLERKKISYFISTYKYWVMSRNFSLRDIELLLGIYFTKEIVEIFHDKLITELNSIILYDDTLEAINSLSKRNMKILLCSNLEYNYAYNVKKILQKNNILNVYPVFSCLVGYIKPQDKIYKYCQDKIKVPIKDVVFVGDSYKNDYEEPYNYGYNAIWLNRKI